ncbi:hypothetical protein TWF730_008389 [Orbilia blumenaviensis]|uniref:DUF6594 domain-containing protein n=1 Tax=Orbilia blumenaviensis TaxID=1796055 RepID=A0AAV9V2Y1_9PEZI
MSNNLLQTEQNVPSGSSEEKKEATEAGAKPSSSSVPQMRDIDFATYDEAGNTLSHTRVVELVRPNEMNTLSVVAVTKQGNPPYLAEVDLSSQDIPLQVESQDPFFIGGGAAVPELVNIQIRPQSEERTSFHGHATNRMVKIPLQTTSRDPNSRGRDQNVSDSHDFSNSRDPEKDAPVKNMTYAPGYPSTAAIMSTDPELSVYRRFDRLNARNLLYYQAELMYIEAELDKLDEEDRMMKEPEAKHHLKHFKELWEGSDSRTIKRRNLVMDMRYLLKEYSMIYAIAIKQSVISLRSPEW